jgi:hypothetical protein
METAVVLKLAAIAFAVLGGVWSLHAAKVPLIDGPDPDRRRRRHYIASYALTSVSMLLLASIGFL